MRRSSDALRGRSALRIGFALVVGSLAVRWWLQPAAGPARARVLDAIRMVESSDSDHPPDGDGGAAIGPYQIHVEYWRDAVEADPSIGGTYQDCRRRDYSERVIDSYMRRYVPGAWERADAEVIARTHNGGPQGASKSATDGYWRRVRAQLR